MTGDGIDEALALALAMADIDVAMGAAGTDSAMEGSRSAVWMTRCPPLPLQAKILCRWQGVSSLDKRS